MQIFFSLVIFVATSLHGYDITIKLCQSMDKHSQEAYNKLRLVVHKIETDKVMQSYAKLLAK